jgi:large subunit ribosomal protein L33
MNKNNYIFKLKNNITGGVKMAAKGAREPITLECTECKRRTYMTEKNKKNNTDRLEIVKYCKFCQKRTTHKETK